MTSYNLYSCKLIKDASVSVPNRKISTSEDTYSFIREYFDALDREHFGVLLLTTRHNVIGYHLCSVGTIEEAIVTPRECIKAALLCNATALILIHNHPSGEPTPSEQDKLITNKIKDAANLFGFTIIDHIIVGENSFFSFADEGML